MSLHLVTQNGQPYGSVRRCCEWCGLSVEVIAHRIGEAATDSTKQFNDSPLSCLKKRMENE
jgi:hypothetical protein